MISEVLHIRPWEIGDLTGDQFREACDYIDLLNEKATEAAKPSEGG